MSCPTQQVMNETQRLWKHAADDKKNSVRNGWVLLFLDGGIETKSGGDSPSTIAISQCQQNRNFPHYLWIFMFVLEITQTFGLISTVSALFWITQLFSTIKGFSRVIETLLTILKRYTRKLETFLLGHFQIFKKMVSRKNYVPSAIPLPRFQNSTGGKDIYILL